MLNPRRTDVTSRIKRSTPNTNKQQSIPQDSDDQSKAPKNAKQIMISLFVLILFIFCAWITMIKYNTNPNNASNNMTVKAPINTQPLTPPQTQHHPSIIVVASINGGTSTLNQIFMYYFKHFFHGFRETNDLYYWVSCIPSNWIHNVGKPFYKLGIHLKDKNTAIRFANRYQELQSNPSSNYKSLDAKFNNLIFKGCSDTKNANNFHCDLSCSHSDYMDHIGYTINNKYKNIYFTDENIYKQYLQSENNNYPNESYKDIYYYWDRTSGYNSAPWISVVLSTNYPHSKLLYVVRDPLTQMYSRIRQFDEITFLEKQSKQLSEKEANRRFKHLLLFVESDPVNNILLPLLKQNEQTEKVENDIIMWYFTLWSIKGMITKDERIFDICPYINILMFIKTAKYYNIVNGVKNFGLMQFEWITNGNLLLASIYIYCWTVFGEWEYGNNCIGKYTRNHYENLDEIMFDWKTIEQNSNYGKLGKYEWKFTELAIFDKLIEFFNICDIRLMGLMEKYQVLLGEFKLDLWNDHRKEIRQTILTKQEKNAEN